MQIQGSLDNRTYSNTDIVPIGCSNCRGCSACCREMGDTIIQDPYDYWNFTSHMRAEGGQQITFELLVSEDGPWEIREHGHMLLPNLKMVEDGRCSFLSPGGRCTIHDWRSGLCRLYPLGRIYDGAELKYYLLDRDLGCPRIFADRPADSAEALEISTELPERSAEAPAGDPERPGRTSGCGAAVGTPSPISDWLGIRNVPRYERFLVTWHGVRKEMEDLAAALPEQRFRLLQRYVLRLFYGQPYGGNFYTDFAERMNKWNSRR